MSYGSMSSQRRRYCSAPAVRLWMDRPQLHDLQINLVATVAHSSPSSCHNSALSLIHSETHVSLFLPSSPYLISRHDPSCIKLKRKANAPSHRKIIGSGDPAPQPKVRIPPAPPSSPASLSRSSS